MENIEHELRVARSKRVIDAHWSTRRPSGLRGEHGGLAEKGGTTLAQPLHRSLNQPFSIEATIGWLELPRRFGEDRHEPFWKHEQRFQGLSAEALTVKVATWFTRSEAVRPYVMMCDRSVPSCLRKGVGCS